MVDLSIIIVNWNTRDYLRSCLASIYAHPPLGYSFEVIVVDNASSDGSVDMVRQEFPQVRLIVNEYNYGFAKATNQGYRISQGRYIMTLNPDARVLQGTLEGIVEFLETHADAGAVVPCIVDRYGCGGVRARKALPRFNPPFFLTRALRTLGLNLSKELRDSKPFEAVLVCDTAITCRREALDLAHFFREVSFMFGEELPLSLEIRQRGYKLYAFPSVSVEHIGGGSRRQDPTVNYMTELLLVSVCYCLRAEVFGVWNAKFNAVLGLIDGVVMWSGLRLKFLFNKHLPSMQKKIILIEWKTRVIGNLGVLLQGQRYFQKVNQRVERCLQSSPRKAGLETPIKL